MDQMKSSEPFTCSYIYEGDMLSVASYEEIFTPPRTLEPQYKQHSYISFLDPDKPQYQYTLDDVMPAKSHVLCMIPKRLLLVVSVTCVLLIAITILAVTDIFKLAKTWNQSTLVPSVIPYEGSEWFVHTDQWGMDRAFTNCPVFKKVAKVTVTPIAFEDENCDDIKACESYLSSYDNNVTVLHNSQWEYEFFFGDDKHVFEGRNWYCFYNPGELRFGYLGNRYDPTDLGPAWGHIHYTIIEFGIKNGLVKSDVCFDIDPAKNQC